MQVADGASLLGLRLGLNCPLTGHYCEAGGTSLGATGGKRMACVSLHWVAAWAASWVAKGGRAAPAVGVNISEALDISSWLLYMRGIDTQGPLSTVISVPAGNCIIISDIPVPVIPVNRRGANPEILTWG